MEAVIHASTVCLNGRAVVVRGPSGAGKSALALDLIARGGTLVADDRTHLRLENGSVMASCPAAIAGLIEARGIGILRVPYVEDVPVCLVVDLETERGPRLPDPKTIQVLEQDLPVVCSPWTSHLAPAIVLMTQGAEITG